MIGRPSNSIVPVSADSTPEMILIIVDLPAPFSPTRACTRPARIVMSALRMARTAPKRFEIPVRCRRAGSDEAVASAGGVGASGAFERLVDCHGPRTPLSGCGGPGGPRPPGRHREISS